MNCVHTPDQSLATAAPDSKRLLKRLSNLPAPVVIFVVASLIVLGLFTFRPHPALKPADDILPVVTTLTARHQTLQPTVTLYGRLETPRQSTLTSTVGAYVKSVLVEEGDSVQEGQLLVELDDRDVQLIATQRKADVDDTVAQIASEQARFENDRKALLVEQDLLALSNKTEQRHERLAQANLGSALALDEAQEAAHHQTLSLLTRQLAVQDHPHRLQRLNAQLDRFQAMLEQAELDVQRTHIASPFSGRISALNVSPGNRLRPGDRVVSVFDATALEVRAQIPSRYLNAIQSALQDNVSMDATLALDGQRIPLQLNRLAGAVDSGQGGVDALFRLEQSNPRLALGRAGELYLHMPALENVVALPPSSIYGQDRIYLVQDNQLRTIEIKRLGETVLQSGEQWMLVRAQLPDGARILTTQLSIAVDGMAVKAVEAAPLEFPPSLAAVPQP